MSGLAASAPPPVPTVAGAAFQGLPQARAFIGMGGNLGEVRAQLASALLGLDALSGTRVEAVSSVYQTAPLDAAGPDYLNAVAAVQSSLGPQELLSALLALELAHDRERPYHHAPRTLDLDLLWYDGVCRSSPSLNLPHPRMMGRAFVLAPLAEVQARLGPNAGPLPALPDAALRDHLAEQQGVKRLDGVLWPLS